MAVSHLFLTLLLLGQDQPHSPQQALAGLKVPEGFSTTLFASEPMVSQPIAMTTDAKGRVWVIENHSYPHWITDGKPGKDKVSILEDTDGDGDCDGERTLLKEAAREADGQAVPVDEPLRVCGTL